MKTLRIVSSLKSDMGRARSINQDTLAVYEPADKQVLADSGCLYIVADGAGGVGGRRAGKVASRFAAAKLMECYYQSTGADVGERMRAAMLTANDAIRAHAQRPGRGKWMATTCVAAVVQGEQLVVANVGDSRAYFCRGDSIEQLTEDHSLVAGLLADGAISEAEAAEHPQRNVILHSLSSAPTEPRIDLFRKGLLSGDIVLLCTDGLTRYTNKERLMELLSQGPIEQAAQRLVDFANAAGGADNVTVAVLQIGSAPLPMLAWWLLLLSGIALVLLSGLLGVLLMLGVI